jgi:signal transduction histidine kinase
MMIGTKLVTTAAVAALENRAQLKPVLAPFALLGKGLVMIAWGTFWKSTVAQLAVVALWIGAFVFTYLSMQSTFMMNATMTILVGFLVFVVTPMTVFVSEIIRVRRLIAVQRDAQAQAASEAAAAAQAQYGESLGSQPAPTQSVHEGEYTAN